MGKTLTAKQFAAKLAHLEATAKQRAARFEGDTAERRNRRKAEAIVFPSRFNAAYLSHYFTTAPAPFHEELYELVERFARVVVRAPRGHAKTTVMCKAYVLHQVVVTPIVEKYLRGELAKEDPGLAAALDEVIAEENARRGAGPAVQLYADRFIVVGAVTDDVAVTFTESVLAELRENALLLYDWGTQISGVADPAPDEFETDAGVKVKAFGMNTAIRGWTYGPHRPSLAVLDDPDDEKTTGTVAQRDRAQKTLTKRLGYAMGAKGRIFVLGTPIDADCLVCRLTDPSRFTRWEKRRYRAITADGRPLWPARWTLEALEQERLDDPDAFESEMMDNPPADTRRPFSAPGVIQTWTGRRTDLKGPLIMAIDPALGRSQKSDDQAVVFGQVTRAGVMAVRESFTRLPPEDFVTLLHQLYLEERPQLVLMEQIGFQELLELLWNTEAGAAAWTLPIKGIKHHTESKRLRILSLVPRMRRGGVRLPADGSCPTLHRQLLDWPTGRDDGPDVLAMLVDEAALMAQGRGGGGLGELVTVQRREAVGPSRVGEHDERRRW